MQQLLAIFFGILCDATLQIELHSSNSFTQRARLLADLRTNAWMGKKNMAMSSVHIENPVVSLLTHFSLY